MSGASSPEIAPLPAVMAMKDVCELIGVTAETARRLINDGALPGHRVPGGRQWVFRTEEVLAAISTWSVDGDVRRPDPTSAPELPASVECSTASGAPVSGPTEISCPAPPRPAEQGDHAWLQECTTAWIEAAAATGVDAREIRPGVVAVGDATLAISAEPCHLRIVDDFGDERDDEVVLVSVRRAAPPDQSGKTPAGVAGYERPGAAS